MRAFVAVGLPEHVRHALEALQRELAAARADVKWVEPANLHLTLKFLDEITDDQRIEIEQLLRRIMARQTPVTMRLGGVGAFPSMTAPRVVWVGCEEGAEALAQMAGEIEQEAAALTLRREERPFAAHLTIGRVRSPRGRRELAQAMQQAAWIPPASWVVSTLTFYRSILGSHGSTYSALAEIPLGGG